MYRLLKTLTLFIPLYSIINIIMLYIYQTKQLEIMNELKQTLKKLHELQYVNPIKTMFDIEGLGEREFTTTKHIEDDGRLDEGIIEIYAYYGPENNPTAIIILEVDLFSREILNSKPYDENTFLILKEIETYSKEVY